jgi:beta-phosphoglucomutase
VQKFGVIFDMDGVIIDSEPIYKMLNKKIFRQLGLTVEEDVQLQYVGVTKRTKWQILKEHYHLEQSIDELIQFQNGIFHNYEWNFKSILFSEVIPFLGKLQELGVPCALASSSERLRVNEVLEQCGLKSYFIVTIAGDEIDSGKPDPEIFLTAAKKLNLPPEHCLVVEDSYNGMVAAKRVNMYGIGIRHQHTRLDLSIADQVVNSLAEIKLENC